MPKYSKEKKDVDGKQGVGNTETSLSQTEVGEGQRVWRIKSSYASVIHFHLDRTGASLMSWTKSVAGRLRHVKVP